LAVAEELLAEDFVDHSPFGPFSADRNGVIADVLTVRDGMMREHWNVVDGLALMIGVGAVPPVG
jgi:hypothetical protein